MGHHPAERNRACARRCGRKGGSIYRECFECVGAVGRADSEPNGPPSLASSIRATDSDAAPTAAKAKKKPFILDPLLNRTKPQ